MPANPMPIDDFYQQGSGRLIAPGHTSDIFNPLTLPKLVTRLARKIRRLQATHGVNTLAGCGQSGLIIAILGYKLKLPILSVRKERDDAHDSHRVNGFASDGTRYLIVDDLIDTGRTVKRIYTSIKKTSADYGVTDIKPVGILLYHSCYGSPYTLEHDANLKPVVQVPTFGS